MMGETIVLVIYTINDNYHKSHTRNKKLKFMGNVDIESEKIYDMILDNIKKSENNTVEGIIDYRILK